MNNKSIHQRLVQIEPLKKNQSSETINRLQNSQLSEIAIYFKKGRIAYRRIIGFFYTTHAWWSIRRWLYTVILPDTVIDRWKPYLKGECNRCGACCKIDFTCSFFVESSNSSTCSIYTNPKHAPSICVKFPFDPKDLDDIKYHIAPAECTFYFEGEPEYPNTWAALKAELRARWGRKVEKVKEVFLI